MLIVPPGRLHLLATSSDAVTNNEAYDVCVHVRDGMLVVDATEGKEPTLRIACGAVMPDTSGSSGLLENLQSPVVENLSDVPVVSAAFAALLEEVAAPAEGTRALTKPILNASLQ